MGDIKVSNIQVFGFDAAMRGMRNPMESHHLADTVGEMIGEKDLVLAKKLVKAGSEHCKFMRQMQIWMDFTAPRYIWSELDTYQFMSKNSESTMHKLLNRKGNITHDMFYVGEDEEELICHQIVMLNRFKSEYESAKDIGDTELMRMCKKKAKKVLPESWLQKRTINLNYQTARNIYHQRKNHELQEEWGVLLRAFEQLPYSELITM